jgi:hypothetical protein
MPDGDEFALGGGREPRRRIPKVTLVLFCRSLNPLRGEGNRMELLDVRLTPIQRRNRAAFVGRSAVAGAREFEPGERVVLRDERGEYFAGTVVGSDDAVDESRYLVHLGVRLPEEFAMLRLGRGRPSTAGGKGRSTANRGDLDVQSVLDLLGDAREALGGRMPSQRLPR